MKKLKLSEETEKIMSERFGKDTIIALATVENEVPFVRYVNAYYENGAFYIITYALSNKMRHMESNSTVAIAGEWFTAHGKSINLGYFGKEENHWIAEKLKKVFVELSLIHSSEWTSGLKERKRQSRSTLVSGISRRGRA